MLLCMLAGLFGCERRETAAQPEIRSEDGTIPKNASGVAVRVPAARYRLTYTDSESLTLAFDLIPTADGAIVHGLLAAEEGAEAEEAVLYGADRQPASTVKLSADGTFCAAAWDGAALSFVTYTDDGKWLLHTGDETFELTEALAGVSHLEALAVQDGTVFLAADAEAVIACTRDGMLLWRQPARAVSGFFTARDGQLLAYSRQEQQLYTVENGAVTELCALPALFATGEEQLYPGDNASYDCLVYANGAFYGWEIAENAATLLFTCESVGLYVGDIQDFCCVGDGQFLGIEYRAAGDGTAATRLFWLTPTDDDLSQTRVLRIAGTRSSSVSMAARDFKAMYPEYEIEFVDYDSLYGEQASQKLLLDLLYGEAPDLLLLGGLPFEQYARQRLLCDLYDCVDADAALSRADFTPNLLRALETDGALYRLPQTYSLCSAAGSQTLVGGREGWTMTEFLDTAEAHPELSSVFAQPDGLELILSLVMQAPGAFVDYEAARAQFDSEEFLRLLTLAAAQKAHAAESPREALLQGEILLEPYMAARTQSFADDLADGLGACAFVGYPGAGRAGFYLTLPMAIPVNAREQDGAWEFLKLLATEPYYAARDRGGWLPVQKDFDEQTAAMEDDSARELLRALQSEAASVFYYDAAICTILRDELPYFFAGEQSAQSIAARIQSRAQLYLTEAYG